jgi:lysophospholipase L1-like esterase
VSYIHTSEWNDFAPVNKADCLPKTYEKLKNGENLNIVVTGSSTAVGGNNSALTGIAPNCPNWADMMAAYWEKTFGADITLTNLGKGGEVAPYGMTVMPETLAANPDLVIIVFGGNDSLHKYSVSKYITNINNIINAVRAQNPACEFIIVSGLLPSTEVVNYTGGLLKPYRDELYKMEGNGIAIADLTAAHEALLQYKNYRDLTGNGIGHTNDFFSRIYAQFIGFMLTEEGR